MTREEMVARKARIDARLAELKLELRGWRREAATTGQFHAIDELRDLESQIARLGQRSQKIQIALGVYGTGFHWNIASGGDRLKRDAGTGDERLEQHVTRTQFET